MPASRPVFAVIDTETTGLSPSQDRVLEIGVVRLDADFEEVDRWETLVHPGRQRIRNSRIHGITDRMAAKAPALSEVVSEVSELLDGLVVIAHNASFDQRMLNANVARELDLIGQVPLVFLPEIQDSLALSRRWVPSGSHSLSALLDRFDIASTGAHTAAADAADTGALLRVMFGAQRPVVSLRLSAARQFDAAPITSLRLRRRPLTPRESATGGHLGEDSRGRSDELLDAIAEQRKELIERLTGH